MNCIIIKKIKIAFLYNLIVQLGFSSNLISPVDDQAFSDRGKQAIAIANLKQPHRNKPLLEMIDEGYSKIKDLEGKDVLFVLGNTGSGKSTTVAYLMGAQLERKRIAGKDTVDVVGDNSHYPVIGHTFISETIYPQAYRSPEGIYIGDCPGFNDTDKNARLAISLNLEYALLKAKKRTLLAVSSYAAMTSGEGRGKTIKDLIRILGVMFPNINDIQSSIIFGFTTLDDTIGINDVLEALQDPNYGVIGSLKSDADNLGKKIKAFHNANVMNKKELMGVDYNPCLSDQENFDNYKSNFQCIENAIQIIDGLKAESVVIINPLREDKKNQIFTKVKNLCDVPVEKFSFEFDPPRRDFKNKILEFAGEVIEIYGELNSLKNQKIRLNQEIDSIKYNIRVCDEGIAGKEETYNSLINQFNHEIKMTQKQINDHRRDLEKKNLDKGKIDNDNLIILEQYNFQEQPNVWMWTEKPFSYSGVPFHSVTEECSAGKFEVKKNSPSEGYYESIFKGEWWNSPKVSVTINIKSKDKPDNKALIILLNKQIKKLEATIGEEEKTKNEIQNSINKLKDEKMNVQRFKEQKNELIIKKELKQINLNTLNDSLNILLNKIEKKNDLYINMQALSKNLPFLNKPRNETIEEFITLELNLELIMSSNQKNNLRRPHTTSIQSQANHMESSNTRVERQAGCVCTIF